MSNSAASDFAVALAAANRANEELLAGRAAVLGPLGEAALFAAARIDHVDAVIAPALARGAFVLCDRFADSTRAYQGAMGKADLRQIALLERVAVGDTRPDLTLMLDLPAPEGLARAAHRRGGAAGPDRFESEDIAFHEGLRRAFLQIANSDPGRCCVVDATQSPQDVGEAIWRLVAARFLTPGTQ